MSPTKNWTKMADSDFLQKAASLMYNNLSCVSADNRDRSMARQLSNFMDRLSLADKEFCNEAIEMSRGIAEDVQRKLQMEIGRYGGSLGDADFRKAVALIRSGFRSPSYAAFDTSDSVNHRLFSFMTAIMRPVVKAAIADVNSGK